MACAVLGGMLGLGAPAGAGTDDTPADGRGGPEHGVTYSGRMQGLRTKLTAIAPTADGEMTLVVEFRLECGSLRGDDAIKKQRTVYVGTDGAYSADVKTSDVYGGVRKVAIHLRGRFTGDSATTARVSYDILDEDDDGTNRSACKESGEVELEAGRASAGLQRVDVAIPLEPDDSSYRMQTMAPTSDAVFLAFIDAPSADSTELFRIDTSTNEVIAHETVPVDLDALVVAGPSLFGIDGHLGTLIPVDPTTLLAGAPIQVVAPSQDINEERPLYPDGAAIDGTLWLSATRDRELVRVDPATGAVLARVPLDAYPGRIMASSTSLYVETQTSPELHTGDVPVTNVIRRIDPASGQVLATSPVYRDDSIGSSQASDEGVVMSMNVASRTAPSELIALDPVTLEVRATAPFQYPVAAAAPGYWTDRAVDAACAGPRPGPRVRRPLRHLQVWARRRRRRHDLGLQRRAEVRLPDLDGLKQAAVASLPAARDARRHRRCRLAGRHGPRQQDACPARARRGLTGADGSLRS